MGIAWLHDVVRCKECLIAPGHSSTLKLCQVNSKLHVHYCCGQPCCHGMRQNTGSRGAAECGSMKLRV